MDDDAGLGNAKPLSILMNPRIYEVSIGQTLTSAVGITQYKFLFATLMHISNSTRPDIAFADQVLSWKLAHQTVLNSSNCSQSLTFYLNRLHKQGLQ
jgi:hypothetical protein